LKITNHEAPHYVIYSFRRYFLALGSKHVLQYSVRRHFINVGVKMLYPQKETCKIIDT